MSIPLVQINDLKMHFKPSGLSLFKKNQQIVKALDGITLSINDKETLGLVGESGSGKTTLGRCVLNLIKPTYGHVSFKGLILDELNSKQIRSIRKEMQIVFQDPYASLNPRMTCGDIIAEPIIIHKLIPNKIERENKIKSLLKTVGLNPNIINRYPNEFSGGQRQRIAIARALAVNPNFIVLDEPISSLDVSIQAQIINLLKELQQQFNLTYLFIAHDLSVVSNISNRVAVMYLGHIVEIANTFDLYKNPLHPYTKALISAIPIPDPIIESQRQRMILEGEVPSPINPPSGCVFWTRCPIADKTCSQTTPALKKISENQHVACLKGS